MKKFNYLFTLCAMLVGLTINAQDALNNATHTAFGGTNMGVINDGTATLVIGHIPANISALAQKNLIIGNIAGDALTTGDNNTLLGWASGTKVAAGQYNTLIGSNSGKLITSGQSNTVVGHNAGIALESGSNNTFVGTGAKAATNSPGASSNRSGFGKGVIVESDHMAVFGNDDTTIVELGDGGGVAEGHMKLVHLESGDEISNASAGTVVFSGSITVSSDMRLKDNIYTLGNTMSDILKLDGKSYTRDGRKEIGLLAQDVELVYPELVSSDAKGMLSVNYQALSAILINGVKDQEARIAKQEERIVKLEILVNLLLNGK